MSIKKQMPGRVLFWLAIFLMGCRPTATEPGPPGQYSDWYWGKASGTRNGIEYMVPRVDAIHTVPGIQSCFTNTHSLGIIEFDRGGTARTEIVFLRVPTRVGVYRLDGGKMDCAKDSFPWPVATFYLLEGDVLLNTYVLVPSAASNHLSITSLDTATGRISGNFDITTVATDPPREGNPDTVRCIGRFETKLRKQDEKYKPD